MKEEDRQRIIRQKLVRLDAAPKLFPAAAVPTGFPSLDTALGVGGLPRGRIVELFGPASSGKSTLALQIVAYLMRNGMSAAWIDAEHVLDGAQLAKFEIPAERLPVARPETAEEAMEVARQLALSRALDLIAIDSAAALLPRIELETGLGESGPSLQSRVLAWGLRRLAAAARQSDTVILVLNQTRGNEDEMTAGGPPLKLHAAVRIGLDAARGSRVRFRILKNKAGEAFREGALRWENGWRFTEPL